MEAISGKKKKQKKKQNKKLISFFFIHRGNKPANAVDYGAVGCIIFTDPALTGYLRGNFFYFFTFFFIFF